MQRTQKTVLITAAGGAAVPGLVRRLRLAGYRVIATDADQNAVGFHYANRGYVTPMGFSDDYFDSIAGICKREKVDAMIPLADDELMKAVELQNRGVIVILPRKEFISTCLDKYVLMKQLEEVGISSPRTRLASEGLGRIVFPLIVKPRVGRGSRGVEVVFDDDRLCSLLRESGDSDKLIIQEYIDGTEYTVSTVVWRDGDVQAVVPKEIILKKGITRSAVTRRNQQIEDICGEVQSCLRADGPFNVQLMYDRMRGSPFIFEINPRFSTTISLTIASGIDELCGVLTQALNGKESYRFGDWEEGVVLLRQTLDECVSEEEYAASNAMIDRTSANRENAYKLQPLLNLEAHPFFVGPVMPEADAELPRALPFSLGVHPKYAIPVLIQNDEIRSALSRAYSLGSMVSTPLGESELARARMGEVLERLMSLYDGDINGIRLLEIGCGNGTLLNELKSRGANVVGLEIGPQGEWAAEQYGITVVSDSLRKGLFSQKFDCIISYGCLEHISELDQMFDGGRACLKDKGLFFHVVPNSGLHFSVSGLSHLIHEHVNYFTISNGVRLFSAQGFSSVKAALSSAGNELMLWGYRDTTKSPRWPVEQIAREEEELKTYACRLNVKLRKVVFAIKNMLAKGETVGFYAGGFEYGFLVELAGVRYFDGDPYKYGKSWIRGMSPIESPQDLKSAPVDNLIICKGHYFTAIRKSLERLGVSKEMRIINLEDLGTE